MGEKILQIIPKGLWYVMVFLLPITSFPPVVKLVGSDVVGAPSGIFLFLLVIIWFMPYILKRGQIPTPGLFIIGFAGSALMSSLLAVFLPIPPFRDISFIANSGKEILTLAVGLSFYLVASTWCSDTDRLKWTIRLVNWSGMLVILWSFAQAAAWYRLQGYPAWMETVHRLLSTGVLYKARVCGFSLEPSWLAHQLNMLYLPIWIGLTVKRESVFRFRLWRKISFENILLAGGAITMLLTFSRVGWAAFLLMAGYLFSGLGGWLVRIIREKIISRWIHPEQRPEKIKMIRSLVSAGVITGLVVLATGFLFGVAVIFRKVDPRMNAMFQFDVNRENPVMWYAQQLEFGPRVIYWQAGWKVFDSFPWLGVGLGNIGYFLPETISAYGWRFDEVRSLMFQSTGLSNAKNLWVRILTETGLVGFILFGIWLFLLFTAGRIINKLPPKDYPLWGAMGLSGILTILGLLVEGFSIDSFALPYFWFSLGLLTASFVSSRKQIRVEKNKLSR